MLHGRIDEDFEDQFGSHLTSHKITEYDGFLPGRNLRGLITTDIMAGVYISNITHVINFEMRCQNYTCTVSVERVVPIKREQQLFIAERKKKSGN
jgi:hypothetical protein